MCMFVGTAASAPSICDVCDCFGTSVDCSKTLSIVYADYTIPTTTAKMFVGRKAHFVPRISKRDLIGTHYNSLKGKNTLTLLLTYQAFQGIIKGRKTIIHTEKRTH